MKAGNCLDWDEVRRKGLAGHRRPTPDMPDEHGLATGSTGSKRRGNPATGESINFVASKKIAFPARKGTERGRIVYRVEARTPGRLCSGFVSTVARVFAVARIRERGRFALFAPYLLARRMRILLKKVVSLIKVPIDSCFGIID
jgi:hypothetical protein